MVDMQKNELFYCFHEKENVEISFDSTPQNNNNNKNLLDNTKTIVTTRKSENKNLL